MYKFLVFLWILSIVLMVVLGTIITLEGVSVIVQFAAGGLCITGVLSGISFVGALNHQPRPRDDAKVEIFHNVPPYGQ